MTYKAATVLAVILAASSPASLASQYLTLTEIGETVAERKLAADLATVRLDEYLSAKWSHNDLSNGWVCVKYGNFLKQNARIRMRDAGRIMTIRISDDDRSPPTARQKFSAAFIYGEVKRDLEDAIGKVDKCFATGRPFE
jgi:hypothetical protein